MLLWYICCNLNHFAALGDFLSGAVVFSTTHCMAVKSGTMQWDPLLSEMPQIQSHSLGAKQPAYLDL